ncbi:MAG: (d)CMP kinase [Actinobacteria bacterium]|nr:(d)CMP kinase [Actinomycetota bacterium]MCL5887632.1 (d)CMP kinase [Actinomycetota bacterium]
MIVAIDGPAGSGKSTVAKAVAERLGIHHLDTGAMYRSVALKALRAQVDLADDALVGEIARSAKIDLRVLDSASGTRQSAQPPQVLLDGVDVTADIRTPMVDQAVSMVARLPQVREAMVSRQQEIGARISLVAEGRDVGTVVFPDAGVKVFLTASPEVRAARRHRDLAHTGEKIEASAVGEMIDRRDEADRTRAVGPLAAAADAEIIDTSDLTIDQVIDRVVDLVRSRS